MKCSRCGAEMKIRNVKVDVDIYGNAIYNKYAYCYHCKIKRNLGQQKAAGGSSRNLSSKRAKKRRRKIILISVISVLLLTAIAGTGIFFLQKRKADAASKEKAVVTDTRKNKISTKSFSKLETGMTFQETLDIIGTDGSRLMQTTSEESTLERYQWVADKGDGAVILTFKDQKLINISQTDMASDYAKLSSDSARKIESEMSYDDVKNALGTDGTLMSETVTDGITSSMYTWYDSDSQIRVTVIFQDDKVKTVN